MTITNNTKNKTMEDKIKELIEVLSCEENLYEQLLEVSREEQQYIIKNETEKLQQKVEEKENILTEIADMEKERQQILKSITKSDKKVGLSLMKIFAKGDDKKSLDNLQKNLFSLLKAVEDINTQNIDLINTSLDYLDFSLSLLAHNDYTIETYDNQGQLKNLLEEAKSLVDRKA